MTLLWAVVAVVVGVAVVGLAAFAWCLWVLAKAFTEAFLW